MPISGPVVHQQLMDAYTQTQARLEKIREGTGQAEQQLGRLDEDRGNSLIKLAEYYLPELTPDAIRQTWAEVQPAISQVFRRKEQESQRLRSELADVTDRRRDQDATLVTITQELDNAVDSQARVASDVEQRLRDDESFAGLSDRAAVAEASLERAESNLHEIEQDSARKLPAYQDSSLFKYLNERGFGTPDYSHRGLTRRMDRWVAKMIDYNKAKQGYDFLRKTPEQMRAIIAEDRQSLDTVMGELERRRDQVAAELGLPDMIHATQSIQVRRDEQLKLIDESLRQSNLTQSRLTATDDSRGEYYREAIQIFRDMLRQIDSRDLKRRAQSTIDLSDDQIVAQLVDVETKIGSISQAAQQQQVKTVRMQSFLEDLGRLIQQFRSAGFDSSRSQFVGTLDIMSELDRAIEAGHTGMMWNEIRSAQRWGPTAMEQITRVATHPMTQVLINAMAHAAAGALQEHARQAGRRWDQQDRTWGGSNSGRGGRSRW